MVSASRRARALDVRPLSILPPRCVAGAGVCPVWKWVVSQFGIVIRRDGQDQGMDIEIVHLAEQLTAEYSELPFTTVVRVVTDCAEEWPDADPHFLEQAATARLAAQCSDPPVDS